MENKYFRTFEPPKETYKDAKMYLPEGINKGRLEDAVSLLPSNVDVLDLGCGYGDLYPLIAIDCKSYLGIDSNKDLVAAASEEHGEMFIPARIEDLDMSYARECVVCLGVMQYLNQSKESLDWFTNAVGSLALKHLIIHFQDAEYYKGSFTAFTKEEVFKSLGVEPLSKHIIRRENDTVTTFRIDL